jgi:hypothetical protein
MELAHRGLQEPGESARARGSPGRLGVTRRVDEHLLDVNVHLAKERRRNRAAVALVNVTKRCQEPKNDYLASMYPKSVPDTLVVLGARRRLSGPHTSRSLVRPSSRPDDGR